MDDPRKARFFTKPFPSNLDDICNLGDLNLKNCTYASFSDQTGVYHALKRYVPEYNSTDENECISESYEITPTFRRQQDRSIEVDPSRYNEVAYNFGQGGGGSRAEQLKRKMRGVEVDTDVRAGMGMHRVKFEGEQVYVLFQEIELTSRPRFNCVVFVIGRLRSKFLQKFSEHALKFGHGKPNETSINIYSFAIQHCQWIMSLSKVPRPLESVFLPKDSKDSIVQDMESYLSEAAHQWYRVHGIPYKRMYLLHGSPGAGKTSLIQALAGHFFMNVCFIQPTNQKFDDDQLQTALRTAPKNSIIVLEDIDALFSKDRAAGLDNKGALSFSGLLNGLDGISTPQGQVFMLTTNHMEHLDPALIRDGRVDLRLKFPKAQSECIKDMFHSFYPTLHPFRPETKPTSSEEKQSGLDKQEEDVSEEEKATLNKLAGEFAHEWATRFNDGVAMATIQQHFIMQRRSTAIECVAAVKDARVWNADAAHASMFS